MQCNVEQLVSLVEKAEPIYNLSIRDHSTKLVIDTKWEEIAEELKCSVFECKTKWSNLRSAYCRYLRDGGNTPRGRRRKKWYMAEKMKFLEKHIVVPSISSVASNNQNCLTNRKSQRQNRPSATNRAPDSSTTSMTVTDECSVKYSTETPIQNNISNEIKMEDSMDLPSAFDYSTLNLIDVDDNDDSDFSSDYKHSIKLPAPKKLKTTFQTNTAVKPSKGPIMTKIEYPKMEDDPDTMFFKSILADYKDLSKKRKRYFRELMVTTMNKLQEEDEDDTQNTMKMYS